MPCCINLKSLHVHMRGRRFKVKIVKLMCNLILSIAITTESMFRVYLLLESQKSELWLRQY